MIISLTSGSSVWALWRREGREGGRERREEEKGEKDSISVVSDVCNVFAENFDQLNMEYSTPHWFVHAYRKFNEEFHMWEIRRKKEGGR